ncbi:MAG: cobalt ABC transporter substrate-binding protein CbiN [Flavobacteriaceae bacterium]|nr:MAG: cobalt ABC transporter substrate-binding protein CbiN [Flavobacteriaceae bacterium]
MVKGKSISVIVVIIAVFVVGVQFVLPFLMGDFKGTDDQAVGLISSINPDYKPWMDHFWAPSGDWGETLVFAFQTTIGVGIIVFYVLKNNRKLKSKKC